MPRTINPHRRQPPPPPAPAAPAAPAGAATAPASDDGTGTRSLDEQIQGLKKDVVDLNKDLFVLEEELLFPANTQVAVFVSMDVGDFFALDSITLKIDNKEVSNYLYTPREDRRCSRVACNDSMSATSRRASTSWSPSSTARVRTSVTIGARPASRFDKGIGAKYLELKINDQQRSPAAGIRDQGLGITGVIGPVQRDPGCARWHGRWRCRSSGAGPARARRTIRRSCRSTRIQDLHYGDVLFHFFPDDDFEALTRLRGLLSNGTACRITRRGAAAAGGLYLSLGMHNEAGERFEAPADDDVPVGRAQSCLVLSRQDLVRARLLRSSPSRRCTYPGQDVRGAGGRARASAGQRRSCASSASTMPSRCCAAVTAIDLDGVRRVSIWVWRWCARTGSRKLTRS